MCCGPSRRCGAERPTTFFVSGGPGTPSTWWRPMQQVVSTIIMLFGSMQQMHPPHRNNPLPGRGRGGQQSWSYFTGFKTKYFYRSSLAMRSSHCHSLTHSRTHSLTHSLTHSPTHSPSLIPTHPLTPSFTNYLCRQLVCVLVWMGMCVSVCVCESVREESETASGESL